MITSRVARRAAILCLSFIVCCVLDAAARAADPDAYGKGRLTTTDATRILFSSARLEGGTVTFQRKGSDVPSSLAEDDVLRVEVQKGNQGLLWAAVIGASGLLGAAMGVQQAESELDGEVDDDTKTTIVLAITGVSVLVGYLVGSGIKKYETVYEHPSIGRQAAPPGHAGLPAPPGTALSVCLRF